MKTASETRVVSYDSPRSIANKVRYAIQKGLGGVMVWSVDTDDFNGDCDEALNADRFSDFRTQPKVKLNFPKLASKTTYPLLRTLNDAIVLTLDETAQENDVEKDKENEIDSHESNQSQPNKPSSATVAASSFLVLQLASMLLKMF